MKVVFSSIFLMVCLVSSAYSQKIHSVKAGETVFSIAQFYEVSLSDLAKSNKINESKSLTPGSKLFIPDEKRYFHIIEQGQTLYSLQRKYGLPLDRIRSLNRISGNNLEVGDTLLFYNRDSLITAFIKQENKALVVSGSDENSSYTTHIVKKGETLFRIARLYNLSVNDIRKLNQLKSDNLKIGQELIITLPVVAPGVGTEQRERYQGQFVTHKISEEESLKEVLNKFKMTIDEFNYLNPGIEASKVKSGLEISLLAPPSKNYQNPYHSESTQTDRSDEKLGSTRFFIFPEKAERTVLSSGIMYSSDLMCISHPSFALGSVVFVNNESKKIGAFAFVYERSTDGGIALSKKLASTLDVTNIELSALTVALAK